MNKLAIVDGDGLLYHASKNTLEESIQSLNERIQNIFDKTEATHYVIFISYTPYFRHKISSEYKASRTKQKSNLKWLKTLKSYLVENWNAQSMNLVEADDLCAYWMNKDLCIADDGKIEPREVFVDALDYCAAENLPQFEFKSMEKVLCAVDKDLLQSISGKHFNYTYKLEDKDNPNSVIKGWWVETSDITGECEIFKATQLLMGDTADNIKCLEKVGKVGAGKILSNAQDNMDELIPIVFREYVYRLGISKGIFEFQKNYRLLHLLENDEDFIREIGQLPELPEIREVSLNPQIEKLHDDLTF